MLRIWRTQTTMKNGYMIQRVSSASATSPCELVTNALVIYEDNATHAWAEATLKKFTGNTRATWKTTWWRLSDLDQPGVLAGAVSSTMRAHLIIVAVRNGGNFPLPFYIWANSWMPHRTIRGSLVGLIGTAGGSRARDYLLAVARQTGLRASIEERDLGPEQTDGSARRQGFARRSTANTRANGLMEAA